MSRQGITENVGQSKLNASSRPASVPQPRKQIKLLRKAIVSEFHPDKIVLFGSYAYGHPRPGSDIDLLIVMPFEGSPFRQAALILGHVVKSVGVVPLDLLVRTPEQVRERIEIGDTFIREIIDHGQVIYEADHA